MALARVTTHTTAADGTFSAAGATAWNAAHTNAITGATSGGIPYFDSTTSEASSALLAAGGLVVGGGAGTAPLTDANLSWNSSTKRLSAGAAAGAAGAVTIGDYGVANFSAFWAGAVGTPSSSNYSFAFSDTETDVNAPTTMNFAIGGTSKLEILTSSVKPFPAVAAQAGGSTSVRILLGSTTGFGIYWGSGAPGISAGKGSLYIRTDGTATNDRAYIATDGVGTWTAITTVA